MGIWTRFFLLNTVSSVTYWTTSLAPVHFYSHIYFANPGWLLLFPILLGTLWRSLNFYHNLPTRSLQIGLLWCCSGKIPCTEHYAWHFGEVCSSKLRWENAGVFDILFFFTKISMVLGKVARAFNPGPSEAKAAWSTYWLPGRLGLGDPSKNKQQKQNQRSLMTFYKNHPTPLPLTVSLPELWQF